MKKLFYYILLLSFILNLNELSSQISWEATGGPFGGTVKGIVEEPDGNILAITFGNVYRSTDKGLNWNKLMFDGFIASKIYYYNENTAFIIPNTTDWNNNVIYRSDDKLSTCQLKNSGMENKGINTLYIKDGKVYANTSDGIYLSTDIGESWVKTYSIPEVDDWISNLAINSKGHLFAGTLDGIFRSTDMGNNWELLDNEDQELETNIENIVINSKDTIFITTPYGPYRSYDNGDTWTHLDNNFPQSNVGFIILLGDEELLAANSWMGIFHSTNSGNDWTKIYDTGGGDAVIAENGNIYVATMNGVLFNESLNGIWEYRNYGITELSVTSVLINRNNGQHKDNIIVGDNNGAIHRSSDNGNSWEFLIKTNGAGVSSLVMDREEFIYAGTIWGGAYRSTDNGDSWEMISNGLNDPDVRTVALDNEGNLYAGTFSEIYKSTDKGNTWSSSFFQNQSVQCSTIAVNSRNVLFAGTIVFGAVRSTNNGLSWTQITDGMQTAVIQIIVNKQDELFAVSSQGDLFKSTNDGDSWSLIKSGMGIERIYSLNNTELLASIEIDHREVGLYRSTDKGLNWISVDEGLDSNYVYSFDYNTEGYIFVATNKGIYRTISSVVAVEEEHQANSLVTISPNPANDYFDINLLHEKSEFISISIFDVLGNRLIDVACGYYGAGNQNFKVNAGSLPQGIYYMNIKTGNESFFKPIMIVK